MADAPAYVDADDLDAEYDYFVDVFALKACEPLGMTMEDAADHLDRAYDEAMKEDGDRIHTTVRDDAFPAAYADGFAADAAEQVVTIIYGAGGGDDRREEMVARYTERFTDLLES